MSSPWWRSLKDGAQVAVDLIQFDLGGHSPWALSLETDRNVQAVYLGRKSLQGSLTQAVSGYGFDRHHWAGDGGLFARNVSGHRFGQDNFTYDAMSQMLAAFERWRSEDDARRPLVCRISGTHIADLSGDRDPGSWYSSDLNSFLKYERLIGRNNTIRITHALRRRLGTRAEDIFQRSQSVFLPTGETVVVYEDAGHPAPPVVETPRSFRSWLRQAASASLEVFQPTVGLHPLPPNMYQYGDSVLLSTALQETGYQEIQLHQAGLHARASLRHADEVKWNEKCAELVARGVKGTRCRVLAFSPELMDSPAWLEWTTGEYTDANAFATLMVEEPSLARVYGQRALRVAARGKTDLPNTLSNHCIVILGKPPDRQLVIAHRRGSKDRPGAYARNRWSVSFEEQFNAVKSDFGKRQIKQDHSIEESIKRGLVEEFIGDRYEGPIHLSIHAFQLESWCVNFGFLAVAELPEMSFAELLAHWPEATDCEEHDVLAVMPLEQDLILECMRHPRLPESVIPRLQHSSGFEALTAVEQRWHPTGGMRLALALWKSGWTPPQV